MSKETKAWNTKYGPRRVRHDPPTLQEAIFAATGLTDDPGAQAEIAASLMGLRVQDIRADIMKAAPSRTQSTRLVSSSRGALRSVVVEHRGLRRPQAAMRSQTGRS